MKILIFTEGTILMHSDGFALQREDVVKQVKNGHQSVHEYDQYIPIKKSVDKLKTWKSQGVEIGYLTSRRIPAEISAIQKVLHDNNFPYGELYFREEKEDYKDVAERVMPDILIEDDCESIGGTLEMTYTHIKPEIKAKIKSIPVSEFGGIDHLPNEWKQLFSFQISSK